MHTTANLQQYFPVIRDRQDILDEIHNNTNLLSKFNLLDNEQQNEFLDFCSGAKGAKILYDSFFKEIMNPEYAPERLNEFLSLILGKDVKIIEILPADSTRIASETSLLIMDIVIQLNDNSIANVEIQKIGYLFPGQRCACYSADLLLRQYKRIRSAKKKKFSYKDIKSVYTIILFEKSPKEFHNFPDSYIHKFEQQSDTGMKMELLQKYIFISLDIFSKMHQNVCISNKLEEWLAFLCIDSPDDIISFTEKYPRFKKMYDEIYSLCLNTEKVMDMFSKELAELDKNTVMYMIDEMQAEIDSLKKEKEVSVAELDKIIAYKDNIIAERDNVIAERDNVIAERDNVIADKANIIAERDNVIAERNELKALVESLQNQLEQTKLHKK